MSSKLINIPLTKLTTTFFVGGDELTIDFANPNYILTDSRRGFKYCCLIHPNIQFRDRIESIAFKVNDQFRKVILVKPSKDTEEYTIEFTLELESTLMNFFDKNSEKFLSGSKEVLMLKEEIIGLKASISELTEFLKLNPYTNYDFDLTSVLSINDKEEKREIEQNFLNSVPKEFYYSTCQDYNERIRCDEEAQDEAKRSVTIKSFQYIQETVTKDTKISIPEVIDQYSSFQNADESLSHPLGKFVKTKELHGHLGSIMSLEPLSSSVFCSSGYDHYIMIWNWQKSIKLCALSGHQASVKCLHKINEFSLASGSFDFTIRIWILNSSYESGECIKTLTGHHKGVLGLITHIYKGKHYLLSSGADKQIKIWNLDDYAHYGDMFSDTKPHSREVSGIVSMNSETVVSGGWDKLVKIWYFPSKSCLHTISNKYMIYCIKRVNNTLVCCGNQHGTITLFDILQAKIIKELNCKMLSIWCMEMMNTDLIICGSNNFVIKMLSLESSKELDSYEEHCGIVYDIKKLSSRVFASCGRESCIFIWEEIQSK